MRSGYLLFRSWPALAIALVFGCQSEAGRGPAIESLTPQTVSPDSSTGVTVKGRGFHPRITSNVGTGQVQVRDDFVVVLEDQRGSELVLSDVDYLDTETLRLIVPGGLDSGWYSATLVGPFGSGLQLVDALRVASFAELDAGTTDAGAADASIADAGPPPLTRFININGPSLTGVDYPGDWVGDSGAGNTCTGFNYSVFGGISGTVDDDLFRGSVFVTGGPDVFCTVPGIPDGTYTVTLLFAETHFGPTCAGGGGVGSRVFNIHMEGNLLESNVDIYSEGGCVEDEPAATPITRQFDVPVSGGELNIQLEAVVDAIISGISVSGPL